MLAAQRLLLRLSSPRHPLQVGVLAWGWFLRIERVLIICKNEFRTLVLTFYHTLARLAYKIENTQDACYHKAYILGIYLAFDPKGNKLVYQAGVNLRGGGIGSSQARLASI